jgi:hypothetical protein
MFGLPQGRRSIFILPIIIIYIFSVVESLRASSQVGGLDWYRESLFFLDWFPRLSRFEAFVVVIYLLTLDWM